MKAKTDMKAGLSIGIAGISIGIVNPTVTILAPEVGTVLSLLGILSLLGL
jgi:hypothetical protein